jgi:FkbM family methyltransferase
MRDGKIVLAEVGVGPLALCFGATVWDRPDVHVQLYEPNPTFAAELRTAIGGRQNVELFEVAIGDETGELELSDEGTSSSLQGVDSPSVQHKGNIQRNTFKVKVDKFSAFDKGDIDLLRVDVEGGEYAVLKHLVSRPEQIVVEIYNDLATYINPHLYDIMLWAEANGYVRAAVHEGDFIFGKSDQPIIPSALPAVEPAMPLAYYQSAVKQMLIASYTQNFYGKLRPDQFVESLSRMFRFKTKVIDNLALYVQAEAQKGHSAERVLKSLDFFARVLKEFEGKNVNQPPIR